MKAMERILTVLLVAAIALLLTTAPVQAQARYGLQKSAAVQTDTSAVLPAGSWVYGIEIFADEANAFMGVYNSATFTAGSDTNVMDEVGEATQYDTTTKMYTQPVYFGTGVSVVMDTGVGFIYYGPQP